MTSCMQLLCFVCAFSSRLLQVLAFWVLGFHPEDSDSIIDLGMTRPYQLVSMSIELHQVVAGISIWTSVLSDFSHLMVSPLKLRIWSLDVLCIILANLFILAFMQKHTLMHAFIHIYMHNTKVWSWERSRRRPKFGRRFRLHEANDWSRDDRSRTC
jgi:hypothetical protein